MSLTTTYSAENIQEFMVAKLAEVLEVDTAEIDVNEHLESYGLDSAQAMVIISQLEKLLGFKPAPVLLWHYPTIATLSQRLSEENQGTSTTVLDLGAEVVLDSNIVPEGNNKVDVKNPQNIFLTGGTGYLAAFIIKELLAETQATIYCLVRAADVAEAKTKLEKNLQQYAIWDEKYSQRLIPIVGDLAQPMLGIGEAQFIELAAQIDTIYHSAALLNYVYPYSALKTANVLGTQEVIRLACKTKVKALHYVSSVAVFESNSYAGKVVKENDSFDDWQGIFLGYSQTKWVSEKIVKIAGERGLPITIYRPPLIAGDSKTGICNTHDFINLMIKGCLQMGSFPDVDYMLDMSPVDYVSKAVVYLSRQEKSIGQAFHLQHPQPASLKSLVEWIRKFGFNLEMISYEQWQDELINNVTDQENPLYTLKPFLLERWSEEQITIPDLYLQARRPIISCEATLAALKGSSIVCPEIDSQLLLTYTSYLMQTGFLSLV